MAASTAKHPAITWAQRSDSLFITINVPDVTSPEIKLTSSHLSFTGTSNGVQYATELELFGEVDPNAEVRTTSISVPH